MLLRDILKGKDKSITAIVSTLSHIRPDILVLQGFDYDTQNHALNAFRDALAKGGLDLTYTFARPPNSGRATGLDLDGDGRLNEPEDALGYGAFTGQGGMAILSRWPFGAHRDFTDFPWKSLPDVDLPRSENGTVFPSQKVIDMLPLSSVAHWDVPVELPNGTRFNLLTYHGNTPAFDGPEDHNGKRGRDETLFWAHLLDNTLPFAPPTGPFAVIGQANIDPVDGEGHHDAIQTLLSHPQLQDPAPSNGSTTDTVDWGKIGKLRTSYILPWAGATVTASGVFWPRENTPHAQTVENASRHRILWVDLSF